MVRGAIPFGPFCPGAGLFAIAGRGIGEVVAEPLTGSGVAEPMLAARFRTTAPHLELLLAVLGPVDLESRLLEKLERTNLRTLLDVLSRCHLLARLYT